MRLRLGWKQDRTIVELERQARASNVPIASRASLKTELSRWENGHKRVSAEYRALFRLIYRSSDEELGFHPEAADETMPEPSEGTSFLNEWPTAFQDAAEEWTQTVERREFLKGAAYAATAATTPALQWLSSDAEAIAQAGTTRVGPEHVDGLREMTRAFRTLDNRYGGAHARETLLRFLAQDVRPLIATGSYSGALGQSLLSAAAEAVQLAGWMTFDTGLHGSGQRLMTQALRLAGASGDRVLGAEILCGLSHQASYLKDGETAVSLARAARITAQRTGLLALEAEAYVMEAHGYACLKQETPCVKALGAAEAALNKADRSADPAYMRYFDEAYLSAKFGHCFKELRDSDNAIRFAEDSLKMDESYVRGRVFNLALLATAEAQAGEVEKACSAGLQAHSLSAQLNSQRASEYIEGLSTELRPYADSAAVQTFRQALTTA